MFTESSIASDNRTRGILMMKDFGKKKSCNIIANKSKELESARGHE